MVLDDVPRGGAQVEEPLLDRFPHPAQLPEQVAADPGGVVGLDVVEKHRDAGEILGRKLR